MAGDRRLPGRWIDTGSPPQGSPLGRDGLPQKLNGVLASQTNAAVLGPMRVLHGHAQPHDVVVPGVALTTDFVQLARNEYATPKTVRLRLARNGTEGRIAISAKQKPGGIVVAGVYTPTNCEYLDLVTWDHYWEGVLLQGDQLWAIGTWAGMVPLNV